MPTITWNLTVNDTPHTVRLEHGYLGKQLIHLDDALIVAARRPFDAGSYHAFTIQGRPAEMLMVVNGLTTFAHFLLFDGQPIPSDADQRAGRTQAGLLRSRYLKDWVFWQGLSSALGLAYLPNSRNMLALRHRLVDKLAGLDVMIRPGISNTYVESRVILIHHAAPLSANVGEQIRSHPRLVAIFGPPKKADRLVDHSNQHTWFILPKRKGENIAELAAVMHACIEAAAGLLSPIPSGLCENAACRHRMVSERRLILINGMLWYFCPECIAAIPAIGEKARQEYENAPNHAWPGLAAALGTAMLAALGLAITATFVDYLAVMLSALVFRAILWATGRAGMKPGRLELATAFVLTLPAVFLGFLLASIGTLLRAGAPLAVPVVSDAWRTLLADPRNLNMALFFAIIGAGMDAWSYLSARHDYLLPAFRPEVEVLPVEGRGV